MFGSEAIKYFDKCLPVLPLIGKAPKNITGWSTFCENPVPQDLQDLWIEKYENHNIGLCLGPESGLIALDIDKEEAKKLCPPSPYVKIGAKGETRFFKYNGEKSFKRHDLGIELLSTGNQTVLPPSIHPDTGKKYAWGYQSILDIDDDLPSLDDGFFKKINQITPINTNQSGRHSTLVEIALAMISRNEEPSKVINEIYNHDKEHHNPPYFYDQSEAHRGTGYLAAINMYTSLINTAHKKGQTFLKPFEIQVTPQVEIKEKEKYRLKHPKFRGIAQDIFQHIYKHSDIPRSRMAVGATISTIGSLLSNRVSINGKIYTNTYNMLVLYSGGGKDYPLKFPSKFLAQANLKNQIGYGAVGSERAVIEDLPSCLNRIDIVDEATKLFMAGQASGSSQFQTKIIDTYTELWSSSGKHYFGKKLAGNKLIGECHAPCVSLFCATTPSGFENSFTRDMFLKGFGPRFMIFFDDQIKNSTKSIFDETNDDITEEMKVFAKKWSEFKRADFNLNNLSDQSYHLPFKPFVRKKLDEIQAEFNQLKIDNHNEPIKQSVAQRIEQHFYKMLIIDTCSQQFDINNIYQMPEVTASNVDWAYEFIMRQFEMQNDFLERHLKNSEDDLRVKYIVDLIKLCEHKGASKTFLTKRTFYKKGIGKKFLDETLMQLSEAQEIVVQKDANKTVFYHASYLK